MTLDSAPEGTVMIFEEAITPSEVEDCLKDTLEHPAGSTADLVLVYLFLGHPPDASGRGIR
jgi:hypothetical protein